MCGVALPAGLRESDQLPEPIFTPATKDESGHDENIAFERMAEIVGVATLPRSCARLTPRIYRHGARDTPASAGIILADTKFEFGSGRRRRSSLIDEVLTPDCSRFWPADRYEPGRAPAVVRQAVRARLARPTGWDKNSRPPPLPDEVVASTRAKYIEAYERLTGRKLD